MAFETLSERLKQVATASLRFCQDQWGRRGLRTEHPIAQSIGWTPTFFIQRTKVLTVAVEVSDHLFPDALKGAAHDITHYAAPISVYQACTLEAFQQDPKQKRVNLLRDHGFGIITVDDGGVVVIQNPAEPLVQHIPQEKYNAELKGLNGILKVRFNAAYTTYRTQNGQGLQECAQIIEALVTRLAECAVSKNLIPQSVLTKSAAAIIDELYQVPQFQNFRAALGGARSFIKTYRNPASHPPATPKEAADKIAKCRDGFLQALRISHELRDVFAGLNYRITIQ